MISPTELSVVWSAYQDIMPIFCFDCSRQYILTLEWLGTFEMVHVGSASLYTREEEGKTTTYTRTDFSESQAVQARRVPEAVFSHLNDPNMRFSSVGIFRENSAALCSADEHTGEHNLVIWSLETNTVSQVITTTHKVGIFQVLSSGDFLLSRDKNGLICVWDTNQVSQSTSTPTSVIKLSDNLQDQEPGCPVLTRSLDLAGRVQFLSTDLNLRRVLIGKVGGLEMLDFWNSAT